MGRVMKRFLLPAATLTAMAFLSTLAQAARSDQKGVASFYADRFHGRTMADGGRFDRRSNHAASRTLPLGTMARVTNLENGRRATVRIRDRGPYVGNRIIDLSPATADRLGFRREGLARVEVQVTRLPPARDRGGRVFASR